MDSDYQRKVIFQLAMDQARYLSAKPAPERTPYVHKYRARTVLLQALSQVQEEGFHFMAYTLLGSISVDVEENGEAFRHFQKASLLVQKVPNPEDYLLDLIQFYNLLGFSLIGRDRNEDGLCLLGKAIQAYQAFKDIGPSPRVFDCEGGGELKQAEDLHTITQFYLAQVYTKLGKKDQAALHCGKTLQRQYVTGGYEPGQFVLNLLGLTDYYNQINFYGQSEYIAMVAEKIVPSANNQLVGKVSLAHARMLSAFLQYSCNQVRAKLPAGDDDQRILNKLVFQIPGVEVKRPKLDVAKDAEGCKAIFRRANTQLKHSLSVFPLDGCVTEHIEGLLQTNKLYSILSLVEESPERQLAMLDRRRQLIEPVLAKLNPKAFIATCQQLTHELYKIYNETFELRRELLFGGGDDDRLERGQEKRVNAMNNCGRRVIELAEALIRNTEEHQSTKDQNYEKWILTFRLSIAKTLSKIFAFDSKSRVELLKQALREYQRAERLIREAQKRLGKELFAKELEMTVEMLSMLPSKIDRVNYGPG